MNEQEIPLGTESNDEQALVLIAHLKETREKLSWSVEDLADKTRISLHVLYALEAGDFDVIERPFVRAFLKKYAEQVGVSVDEVDAVFPGKKAPVEEPEDDDRSIPIVPKPRIPASLIVRVGVVILAAVGLWIWAPWAPRDSGSNGQHQNTPAGIRRDSSVRVTTLDTIPKSDTIRISASSDAAASEPGEQSDEPVLRPITVPPVVQRYTRAGRLGITARETLWVQIMDLDSQLVYDRIMTPGMNEEWDIERTLRIALGRHWAAQVTFNGDTTEVPHGTAHSTVFYCSSQGISRRPRD